MQSEYTAEFRREFVAAYRAAVAELMQAPQGKRNRQVIFAALRAAGSACAFDAAGRGRESALQACVGISGSRQHGARLRQLERFAETVLQAWANGAATPSDCVPSVSHVQTWPRRSEPRGSNTSEPRPRLVHRNRNAAQKYTHTHGSEIYEPRPPTVGKI
jgi:hypothetical protein